MTLTECYRLLGLESGASFEEVKTSYRRLVRRYHPDVNPSNTEWAKEKFIELTHAYQSVVDALTTPSSRMNGIGGAQGQQQTRQRHQQRHQQRNQQQGRSRARSRSRADRHPYAGQPSDQGSVHQHSAHQHSAHHSPVHQRPVHQPPVEIRPNPNLSAIDNQLKITSYQQLQEFLKDKRFARAIALVDGLAQRIPSDPEVKQWQAIAYQQYARHFTNERQYAKAKVYLKKALRIDPNNRTLWADITAELERLEQILQRDVMSL